MRVPVLVLLLVVAGCKAEPPEKLRATPDKAQPAVAVVPFAPPQQVRPPQLELLPAEEGTVDPNDFFLADPEHPPAAPVSLRGAVAQLLPKGTQAPELVEDGRGVRVTGRAASHAAVAEAMRALSTLVRTPNRGLAELVERKEGAATGRVRLLDGSGHILDYVLTELQQAEVELVRADVTGTKGEVAFELRVGMKP